MASVSENHSPSKPKKKLAQPLQDQNKALGSGGPLPSVEFN